MLEILRAGLSLVQDQGRFGFADIGVACAGFADAPSAALCNHILGNLPGAACLEIHQSVFALRAYATVAVCGFGAFARLDVRRASGARQALDCAQRVQLAPGDELHIAHWYAGRTLYLACAPGLAIAPVLGSQSTDVPNQFGGFKGRFLQRGDLLHLLAMTAAERPAVTTQQSLRAWPLWSESRQQNQTFALRFIAFERKLAEALSQHIYTVRADSSRVALRLQGAALAMDAAAGSAVSAGVVPGCIQITAQGEPLVLGVDAQTLGGYPLAGCVIAADLAQLAQLSIAARVVFVAVEQQQAQQASAKLQRLLDLQCAHFTPT
jgi:biotin-dependent carboxylase-like uncharacterized protein